MDTVARLDPVERSFIFQQTAANRGYLEIAIEKDFWVCWTLARLFPLPKEHPNLLFKGGTSLSKVFNLIGRFSEDIDLSVEKEDLGHPEPEDLSAVGSKERGRYLIGLDKECRNYVEKTLLPHLRDEFAAALGTDAGTTWRLLFDEEAFSRRGDLNLIFEYPIEERGMRHGGPYFLTSVKMEFGPRSDHWPNSHGTITPYASEDFPDLFEEGETEVRVINPERTFWDKALILHREYFRFEKKGEIHADKCSRHYYDLAMLGKSPVAAKAIRDKELLRRVVEHQRFFFDRRWANYGDAGRGSLKLVPQERLARDLDKDFHRMEENYFSVPPTFDEILHELRVLETTINSG